MKLILTRYKRLRNRLQSWFKYTLSFQILGAFHFMKLSWKMLWGKIGLMDTELMNSNVGYKYKAYIITKLPVSTKHTYEDL